jgi:hypothetical protein
MLSVLGHAAGRARARRSCRQAPPTRLPCWGRAARRNVFNMFLQGVIGGTTINSSIQMVSDIVQSPERVTSLLGVAIPASSKFFLQYVGEWRGRGRGRWRGGAGERRGFSPTQPTPTGVNSYCCHPTPAPFPLFLSPNAASSSPPSTHPPHPPPCFLLTLAPPPPPPPRARGAPCSDESLPDLPPALPHHAARRVAVVAQVGGARVEHQGGGVSSATWPALNCSWGNSLLQLPWVRMVHHCCAQLRLSSSPPPPSAVPLQVV